MIANVQDLTDSVEYQQHATNTLHIIQTLFFLMKSAIFTKTAYSFIYLHILIRLK